jgi:protein-tyrosine phosphatase
VCVTRAKAESRPVLVHCVAGKNRSVTTVAIFMVLRGYSPNVRAAIKRIAYVPPPDKTHLSPGP